MRIAIIGSGIAGNTLGYYLHKDHDITIFEANDYIGGHTHTHSVNVAGETHQVDTGFIVFNDRTYPHFIQLLNETGVAWQGSNMSFSVRDEDTGLEYNGTTLNSLFAQRRNLFSPRFYRMVSDILRFNKASLSLLNATQEIALGDYLNQNGYSAQFVKHYIVPMGAAIWSTDTAQMLQFPARFFVRFFHHHGMLSVDDRPTWRTIKGGSSAYVSQLTAGFKTSIKCNAHIEQVTREKMRVLVKVKGAAPAEFDYVFFACHSDQALNILGNSATANERSVLSKMPYQDNSVYLHTDARIMPKRPLAWAAWNYHVTKVQSGKVQVTYDMNSLQNIKSKKPLLVTLNHTANIDESQVIKKLNYMHPLYTLDGIAAQARHADISGHHRTGFAGAYWFNGFHEDGVKSALTALEHFKLAQQKGLAC